MSDSDMKDTSAALFDDNAANAQMDLYSRQIAALGVETMKSLGSLRVLVVGLCGVGVETAKDLILQGPKGVVVHDTRITKIEDLGTNFYLSEKDVGVNPRSVCVEKLSELNPYVQVQAHDGELTPEFLGTFGAVIITEFLPYQTLVDINKFCRTNNITFIWAVAAGGYSSFFADFGPAHLVTDLDGEPRRDFVVQSISGDFVKITSDAHGFSDGDQVVFNDIEGPLAFLNEATGVQVKRVYSKTNGRSVLIADTFRVDLSEAKDVQGNPLASVSLNSLDWNNGGGTVSEVKPSKTFAFRSFADSLTAPVVDEAGMGLVQHMDQGKFFEGRGNQLHLGQLAILQFSKQENRAPALHSKADARAVVKLALDLNEKHKSIEGAVSVDKLDEELVHKMALYFQAQLSGFCAFLGGVAAQEVLKRFGKWTPVYQWLYYDIFSVISTNVPVDAVPVGSRYDHQISIFGKGFQNKIMNERWFLVGCGALGCEYIKSFALMGVCAGPKGHLYITDMDRIELSNLSRQFLFREQHVRQPKSVCAAKVASTMNPQLGNNITAYEQKVCPETEDMFHAGFWDSLTGVWNALDNVHARKYTDGKCLLHSLPLMESGTQGTKANSEVILPFKTKSYSDIKDQETGGIAACTLRNFPNLVLHCIEWAKPRFQELFELLPSQVNAFLDDRDKFFETLDNQGSDASKIKFLKEIEEVLVTPRTVESCVSMAQRLFVESHRDMILTLTDALPEDARVTDPATGADLGPFWTGAKRFPQAAQLDKSNEEHSKYVYYAANLFAYMMNLPVIPRDQFDAVFAQTPAPAAWSKPKFSDLQLEDKKEGDDEKEDNRDPDEMEAAAAELQAMIDRVNALDASKIERVRVNEFEKDDDTNFHIDFITALSNMRAWNYRIKPATRLHVKTTAGKIIAALATTTAMITGVTCLEYYKLALGEHFLHKDRFYNSNINLAAAVFNAFEPDDAIRTKPALEEDGTLVVPYPNGFTTWDYIEVQGKDMSINDFVAKFPQLHLGVRVNSLIRYGVTDEDIQNNRASMLYDAAGDVVPHQAIMMLKRPNLSDAQRKMFEKQVADAERRNSERRARFNRKLIDVYVDLYGPLPSDQTSFVVLEGVFELPENVDETELITKLKFDPEKIAGVNALVPRIKFFFK